MALVTYTSLERGTTPLSSLQQALTGFKAALTGDQRSNLQQFSSVPDISSVIVFVSEVDAANHGSRRSVASRLCSFLEGVQQFTTVVDTFVSSNPAIAALVWGSIKTSILVAYNALSYFDQVTTMIGEIGRSCPTFDQFGQLYKYDPNVQVSLCDYYAIIIRICTKIVEVRKRSGPSHLLQSFKSNFELDFKPLRDELERAEKHLLLQLHLSGQQLAYQTAQVISQQQDASSRYHRVMAHFRSDVRQEREQTRNWQMQYHQNKQLGWRNEILDSLSEMNSQKTWSMIQSQRILGTAEWFKQESSYQDWRSPVAATNVLWFSGMLGVGKSVLLSSVIADLKQTCDTHELVGYHFCQSERHDSLSSRGIIGNIARQLLMNTINRMEGDELHQLHKRCQQLELEEMNELLVDFLDLNDAKICFIVLDGLDECPEDEVARCLLELNNLRHKIREKGITIKILYSSRPELESSLTKSFSYDARISIDRCKVELDNQTFIDMTLRDRFAQKQLVLQDQNLLSKIADVLDRECCGMFLWLVLFIDELCDQNSDAAILKALEQPPRKLSELYDRRYRRIQTHRFAKEANNIIQFIGVTKQPLELDQLREILAVELGDQELKTAKLSNDIGQLIKACYGLVSVDEQSKTVHYVHSSLHSHFFMDTTRVTKTFSHKEVELHFGSLCLTYLHFKNLSYQLTKVREPSNLQFHPIEFAVTTTISSRLSRSQLAQKILNKRRERNWIKMGELPYWGQTIEVPKVAVDFTFWRYAKRYWYYHVAHLEPDQNPDSWKLFDRCVESDEMPIVKPWLSADNISDLNLEEVDETERNVEWALNSDHEALFLHQLLKTSKRLTLATTKKAIAYILSSPSYPIEKLPYYINCVELASQDEALLTAGSTALHYAAYLSNVEALRRLLSSKVNINAANRRGETALHTAVGEGSKVAVSQLLDAGIKVDASDSQGCTALHIAASKTFNIIVIDLLLRGADVNKLDRIGESALRKVVDAMFSRSQLDPRQGAEWWISQVMTRKAIITALVEADADVSTVNFKPIVNNIHATGVMGVLDTLLTRGKRPEYVNTDSLQSSVVEGNVAVVRSLLLNYPSITINAIDIYGHTALFQASYRGFSSIVETLLAHEADANIGAPIVIATIQQHTKIVQLLIKYGADVNAASNLGSAEPLEQAASAGRSQLYHHNFENLHVAQWKNGGPYLRCGALYNAVRSGNLVITKALLAAGADVNATSFTSSTALHHAVSFESHEMCQTLLEAGARSDLEDSAGYTAVDYANRRGSDFAQALFPKQLDPSSEVSVTTNRED